MSYSMNAADCEYELVTVCGLPMLFSNMRIRTDTVPAGLHKYEVRHDDECQGIPCEVADWILVNFWGTLLSSEPIKLNSPAIGIKGNRYIDESDWNYEGEYLSIEKYLNRFGKGESV